MLLKTIAAKIGAKLEGNPDLDIARVANLVTAKENELSFLNDPHYRKVLSESHAGAVIVRPAEAPHVGGTALIMDDPYVGFAKAAQLLDTTPPIAAGIDSSARIADSAEVAADAAIGANAVISAHAKIGAGAQIGAGCFIGPGAQIGAHTRLYPNVTIYHDVKIGDYCLFQSGAVIGGDGFGYANERGTWIKIPQTGRVIIGSHVEIGACTCVDRGAIDDTVIADNVIIDNLCQIAHNVHIGFGTAVAGGTVFAGSVKIGKFCIIGGTSVFNGHIEICDQVTISGMCMVMRSIDKPGIYSSGIPAQTNREWRLTAARVLHINDMYHKLADMENQIAVLQNKVSALGR